MEPLLDVHLVSHFLDFVVVVIVLVLQAFPDLLHLPASRVHQLDHAVGSQHGQDGDEAEDDAAVDVGHLTSLKVLKR